MSDTSEKPRQPELAEGPGQLTLESLSELAEKTVQPYAHGTRYRRQDVAELSSRDEAFLADWLRTGLGACVDARARGERNVQLDGFVPFASLIGAEMPESVLPEIYRAMDPVAQRKMRRAINRVLRALPDLPSSETPPVATAILQLAAAIGAEEALDAIFSRVCVQDGWNTNTDIFFAAFNALIALAAAPSAARAIRDLIGRRHARNPNFDRSLAESAFRVLVRSDHDSAHSIVQHLQFLEFEFGECDEPVWDRLWSIVENDAKPVTAPDVRDAASDPIKVFFRPPRVVQARFGRRAFRTNQLPPHDGELWVKAHDFVASMSDLGVTEGAISDASVRELESLYVDYLEETMRMHRQVRGKLEFADLVQRMLVTELAGSDERRARMTKVMARLRGNSPLASLARDLHDMPIPSRLHVRLEVTERAEGDRHATADEIVPTIDIAIAALNQADGET